MKNKYEVIGVVGEGAYGIVYKCKNKETGKYVAIKKFKETEDELVQKTMRRELKMLQQLKHENIVDFQESFTHKGNLFLVFEYCEKNLLEVLEESPDGLSPKLIKSFIYQMCKAISYMHKNNMIHRDIKPENLLIDDKLNLKLCDFGFARKVKLNKNNNNITEMTDYVATRWYRSPELLLSGGIYGPDVDYWAVGCIMGELADGNPMFPGENETDQINCIIKVLGNIPEELVSMFYKNPIYEGKELLKVSKPETLERRYIGKLGPTAIDFMKGLLQLDPKKRLNSETVFKHKYFSCFMKDNEEKSKKIDDNSNKENINKNNIKEEKEKTNIIEKKENLPIKENKEEKELTNENKTIFLKKNAKSEINIKEINGNNLHLDSLPPQKTETKVINNTTNINIINYNNINNQTNNFIEIHNSNIQENLNNNIINKNSLKDIKNGNNSKNNNILINNSMIIKVSNSNDKDKISKIEIKNNSQNNVEVKCLNNNQNFSNNTNKSINMNNNINFQNEGKKSLSVAKFMKMNDYHNMSLMNNMPNLMTISLSQGKNSKYNKINSNNMYKDINNISSTTFYTYKNKGNKSIIPKKTFYNNISNNNLEKNLMKNGKYNFMPIIPHNNNNIFGGYKTFFNKKNDDKYNYDINTNYFKEELKKYSNNYGNNNYNNFYDTNVIDENEEYIDENNNGIKKNLYPNNNNNKFSKKKNSLDTKKLEMKIMAKYKDNNLYATKFGKFNNKKSLNGYGTLYNYGHANKKNYVELPQLVQIYNKNATKKNNNSYYNAFSYNKKY